MKDIFVPSFEVLLFCMKLYILRNLMGANLKCHNSFFKLQLQNTQIRHYKPQGQSFFNLQETLHFEKFETAIVFFRVSA